MLSLWCISNFRNFWWPEAEILTKNIKNTPKMGFSPICDPQDIFFKNRALSLLYPYGALTSCIKLEKNNELSPRYLKTDQRTNQRTNGQGWSLRTPLGEPGVQNSLSFYFNCKAISLGLHSSVKKLKRNSESEHSATQDHSFYYVLTRLFWTLKGVLCNHPRPSVSPSLDISDTAHYFFLKFCRKLQVNKIKNWHGQNIQKNLNPGIKGD